MSHALKIAYALIKNQKWIIVDCDTRGDAYLYFVLTGCSPPGISPHLVRPTGKILKRLRLTGNTKLHKVWTSDWTLICYEISLLSLVALSYLIVVLNGDIKKWQIQRINLEIR